MEDKVTKSISRFNKYRSPEAHVDLVSINKDSFKIEFSGRFCRSCGFHDYFDDFVVFAEELGLKTKIARIDETKVGAIVEFKVKE